jgi:hypothetical protein
MPEFLIKIPKEKEGVFLKAVNKMDYASVKDAKKNIIVKSAKKLSEKNKKFTDGQLQFAKEIWEGLQEIEKSEKGKIELKPWNQLYKELNEK